jgi:APA family basic amino acid/polyamine antiporter
VIKRYLMEKLKKKYGLPTAICMVIGIVIGSGIFFKAQDILSLTAGNALHGVLSWLIGGAIMVVFASTFAIMATRYEKTGGVVDYAEATCGKSYAYFVGWFLTFIYYPAMSSVLAWVCARYTMVGIFGYSSVDPEALFGSRCITIAAFYLILMYFINVISPKLAGKLQVSTTVIKMIPIIFIAIVGMVVGLVNGNLGANFTAPPVLPEGEAAAGADGIIAAVSCAAFAYEGWIIATAINAEIKNSKRNLPIALLVGSLIIVGTYVLYYLGILGLLDAGTLMSQGTSEAFKFFGAVGSSIMNFLIIISCLGTLNGLTVAYSRSMYSLAARGEGISPKTFSTLDKETNMPANSAVVGLLLCACWFVFFIGGQFFGWFGLFAFDSSELPIITIYPIYVPMLIAFMIKSKDLGVFKRFVLPALCIIGAGVMVVASIYRHGTSNLFYLAVFEVIMLIGAFFFIRDKLGRGKKAKTELS